MRVVIILIIHIYLSPFVFASSNFKTNSIGQKFVLIKSGDFLMGADYSGTVSPIRKVKLTKNYFMQITEVTQGQWFKIMKTKPWMKKGYGKKGKNYAASCISWYDAKLFIEKLNRIEKTKRYRLPYEAEWEYACRAGSNTEYCFGNDRNRLMEYGWYRDNSSIKGEVKFYKKVGLKIPNQWGLYDMHGNVAEWCEDWFGYYKPDRVIDPKGSSVGYKKILRGGGVGKSCFWFNIFNQN